MHIMLMEKEQHLASIIDPRFKKNDVFSLHNGVTNKGYYVKDVHCKDYDPLFLVLAKASSYLDMLN